MEFCQSEKVGTLSLCMVFVNKIKNKLNVELAK